MFGEAALNAWIAACWKFVWNVDPAALIVPLTEAEDDDEVLPAAGVVEVDDDEDELDEEHAASSAIAMTAPPAVTACFLPRSCITSISSWLLIYARYQGLRPGVAGRRGRRTAGVASRPVQSADGQPAGMWMHGEWGMDEWLTYGDLAL
jgi:hypothetical protein